MRSRTSPTVHALLWCLLLTALTSVPLPTAYAAAPAAASSPVARTAPLPGVVSDTPAPRTPDVLDGSVYAVVQVGRTIVLGGTFTRVREEGRTVSVARRGLVAFDAASGRILKRFAPNPRGAVRTLLAAPDGRSVYVGGEFRSISGTRRARLALLRVSDGSVVRTFQPGKVAGTVKDLALSRGRLWVAGAFTHVDGHPQKALATLGPRTGAYNGFMTLRVRGHHLRGVTQVLKISLSPDGSRLVAIGNFATLDGVRNAQLAVLDLRGRRAAPGRFRTSFYATRCSHRFDSHMRDVDVSPDGSYVVIGTTGAYGGSTGSCDTVARFELGAVGADVRPSWVDYSGGDTTYSVEATAGAIYVGGHQRWWNNPFRSNRPGPGAVERKGIAALDPSNGLPLAWNPGRERGVGVFDFLVTARGLWVASDTSVIAGQDKGRIALFPAGGRADPVPAPPGLPVEVFLSGDAADGAGREAATGLRRRTFTGSTAGPDANVAAGGLDWSTVTGAFMVGTRLYVAQADGRFTERCFDGTTYGPTQPVSAADALIPVRGWSDDVRSATGMFFDGGRVYFTVAGSPHLFYRYFSPQSGVVGADRFVAASSTPGLDLSAVTGMFVARDALYWATPDGTLHGVRWRHGAQAAAPVGTPWQVGVGAPGAAGWSSRALFPQAGGRSCS